MAATRRPGTARRGPNPDPDSFDFAFDLGLIRWDRYDMAHRTDAA